MVIACLLLLALLVAPLLWLLAKSSGIIKSTPSGQPRVRGCPPVGSAANGQAANSRARQSVSGLFSATSYYRLKDGSGDYLFRFQQIADGSFQVYILRTPHSRNGPDPDGPHVLRDTAGLFICWSVPIEDYADAKEIAGNWAEATEQWHKTGKIF